MMLESSALERAMEIIGPEDFYRPAHQTICDALFSLSERDEPADLITLTEELRKLNKLDACGGADYLFELVNSVPTAANVQHYANIVEQKSILRKLIAAGGKIINLAYDETSDVEDITDEAEKTVFSVAQKRVGEYFRPIAPLVTSTWEWIEKRYQDKGEAAGLATGFSNLDSRTGGLQASDLIILAARPSMGKTALALDIGLHAASKLGETVAIFSLEMSAEQLVQRMVCSKAKANAHSLRTGRFRDEEWQRIADASSELMTSPIFIDDSTDVTVLNMRAKCRRLRAEQGLGLVIVDYLQLMRGHNKRSESRQQEISDIARGLKGLAREMRVPVIALSQLSRAVERRDDKRPMLSDLRESGSIEAEADLVAMLYRDAYYKRKELFQQAEGMPASVEPEEEDNTTEVIIAKHRNGPTGVVKLSFIKEFASFEDLDEEHTDDF